MIKFGLDAFETEFGDWSKHHKSISIQVRREYLNGKETVHPKDESIIKLVANNEDKLLKKRVSLFNFETGERIEAVDYFLPLINLEYKEKDVEYYSIGSSNTRQTSKVRLHFKIEYIDFFIDYTFKSEGSYATSFYDILSSLDVGEMLEELIENEEIAFNEKGIKKGTDDDFYIVGVDEYKQPIEFEISSRELEKSLISIEVYEHEMIID